MTKSTSLSKDSSSYLKNQNYDVYFGRGRKASKLPGNLKYKELLYGNCEAYNKSTSRYERDMIAEQIVSTMEKKFGTRFLISVKKPQQHQESSSSSLPRRRPSSFFLSASHQQVGGIEKTTARTSNKTANNTSSRPTSTATSSATAPQSCSDLTSTTTPTINDAAENHCTKKKANKKGAAASFKDHDRSSDSNDATGIDSKRSSLVDHDDKANAAIERSDDPPIRSASTALGAAAAAPGTRIDGGGGSPASSASSLLLLLPACQQQEKKKNNTTSTSSRICCGDEEIKRDELVRTPHNDLFILKQGYAEDQQEEQQGEDVLLTAGEQQQHTIDGESWIQLRPRSKILRKVKQALRDLYHRIKNENQYKNHQQHQVEEGQGAPPLCTSTTMILMGETNVAQRMQNNLKLERMYHGHDDHRTSSS